jgi:hypothetical protein
MEHDHRPSASGRNNIETVLLRAPKLEMGVRMRGKLSARIDGASVTSVEALWDSGGASDAAGIAGVSSFTGIADTSAAIMVSVTGTAVAAAIDSGMRDVDADALGNAWGVFTMHRVQRQINGLELNGMDAKDVRNSEILP